MFNLDEWEPNRLFGKSDENDSIKHIFKLKQNYTFQCVSANESHSKYRKQRVFANFQEDLN